MLRQVIAAGLVDQVARLNTARSEAGFLNEDKAEKQYQYITCRTNEEVYIHPSSFLFGKHDEYVVYRHAILQSCHVLNLSPNCSMFTFELLSSLTYAQGVGPHFKDIHERCHSHSSFMAGLSWHHFVFAF